MIKEFEKGKYYRWAGPNERQESWAIEMFQVLDGKPRKCLYGNSSSAEFEGVEDGYWDWYEGLEHWEEVPAPGLDLTTPRIIPGDVNIPVEVSQDGKNWEERYLASVMTDGRFCAWDNGKTAEERKYNTSHTSPWPYCREIQKKPKTIEERLKAIEEKLGLGE